MKSNSLRTPPIELTATLIGLPIATLLAIMAGNLTAHLVPDFGTGISFLIALGFAVVIAALSSMRTALLILIVATGFSFGTSSFSGLEIRTTDLLLFIIAAQVLVYIFSHKVIFPKSMVLGAALIVFGAVIASVAGPFTSIALGRTAIRVLLPLFVIFATYLAIRSLRDLFVIVNLLAITVVGVSILSIAQITGLVPGLNPADSGRANALFEHPNTLGIYLTVSVLVLIGVISYNWKNLRSSSSMLMKIAVLMGITGILLSLSRGSYIGFSAGLLTIILLTAIRRNIFAALSIVGVVALGVVFVLTFAPSQPIEDVTNRIQQIGQPDPNNIRAQIHRQAWRTITEYPLTGAGPLVFGNLVVESTIVRQQERIAQVNAHNIYLEGYISVGLLGFFGILLLTLAAIQRLLRMQKRSDRNSTLIQGVAVGIFGALVANLLEGWVDAAFWQIEFAALVAIFIGIAYALPRIVSDDSAPSSNLRESDYAVR